MQFLNPDKDFSLQIRAEILDALTEESDYIITQAEATAISQITGYISGRYDAAAVFAKQVGDIDTRNAFMVMLVIDLMLYHIWSKEGRRIPQVRSDRYTDAVEWLKAIQRGNPCDLPPLPDTEVSEGPQIFSAHAPNDNKF